jgi:hypothetical protein
MIREEYLSLAGEVCVVVDNPDGTYWSGLKSTYDEMLAQQEANRGVI